MDPNRRLQVLNQANPSLRLSVAPTPQVQVQQPTQQQPQLSVSTPQPPSVDYQVPTVNPDTFKGFSQTNGKTKTIFGLPVGNIMGQFGKTYDINADQNIQTSQDSFLKQFDALGDSNGTRRAYVADLQKRAPTDPVAAQTIKVLQDSGRFNGSATDFLTGSNDKLYGGITRGLLRGADALLPGHNTFGFEQEANREESQPQFTQAGKVGNTFGSAEKGVTDLAVMAAGGAAVTAGATKIPGVADALENLANGSKVAQIGGKVLTRLPGFGAEGGVQTLQSIGAGDKQTGSSVGKNFGIAAALEAATPVAGKFLGKLFKGGADKKVAKFVASIADSNDENAIANEIAKVLPDVDKTALTESAKYLAGENSPTAIKAVLDELSTGQTSQNLLPGVYTAENPAQSTIPAGQHAPNAADPVVTLQAKAKEINDPVKFQEYVNSLTGEEKAAADSAFNGKTADEFYKLANPDSAVADAVTPAVNATPEPKNPDIHPTIDAAVPQEAAPTLEDLVAGKKVEAPATQDPALVAKDTPQDTNAASPDTQAKTEQGQAVEQALADSPTTQSGTADGTVNGDGSTVPADVAKAKEDVIKSLSKAQAGYDAAAEARTVEKGTRIQQGSDAFANAGGGAEGLAAKKAALYGKYSESGFNPIDATPEVKKSLIDHVESLPIQDFEKLNTQVALQKIFGDVAGKPTPYDINLLRKNLGADIADTVEKAVSDASLGQKAAHITGQIAGAPKSMMASMDLSGTLRQGGILATRFPKEAAAAFKDQVKYFGSTQAFKDGMAEIAARPTYDMMHTAGLAVNGAEGLTGTEEQFVSNLTEKIPGFGRGIAASDRAYSGYLTKLRADVFDHIVNNEKAMGNDLSEKALKDIATFINTASGRGSLGMLEKHAQTLSTALFSPRLWKSRLDMLNPIYYAKLDPTARKYALQSAATFASTASTVLGLAALAGASVETDARSSDFGKIKVGNTRYDILGGLQQNIVFAWREISGEKKNSETGDVTSLTNGKYGAADRLSIASDFVSNKENPLLATAGRILKGKDRGGNPVNPLTEMAKLAIPLPIQGVYSATQDIGSVTSPKDLLKGAAMSSPDAIGISAQTYGSVASKDKGPDGAILPGHEKAIPEFTGKITPDMVTDPQTGKVFQDPKTGLPVKATFPKGATDLEKQALIDEKRATVQKDQYKSKLSTEDQALLKLQPKQLKSYLKDGQITQEQYDHIEQYGQDIKNLDGIETPEGARSASSQAFFKKYNALTPANQKKLLESGTPDANDKSIAEHLNQSKSKGLSDFVASPKLSKAYSEFENDINTHPEYTSIDKRNKTKAFQTFAYKQNYNQNQQDIYAEGGSSDLKTLLDKGSVSKDDLAKAMKMDEELYTSGLTGSLKFNKKFRTAYGFNVPTGAGGPNAGSGSSGGASAHLASLLPSFSKGSSSPAPQFSSRQRSSAGAPRISFKSPAGVIPGEPSKRVTISPFRTTSAKKLGNSVAK